MKRLFVLIFALLLTTTAFARPEQSVVRSYVQYVNIYLNVVLPPAPETEKEGPSVGELRSRGSAVVIAPNYAVSAWHVFKQAESIPSEKKTLSQYLMSPTSQDNTGVPIEIIAKDEEHDLVLLKGSFGCPCAPLGNQPELDETVYTAGFSAANVHGLLIVSPGTYQGVSKQLGLHGTLNFTAPGGSGGGLFQKQDGAFKLVGIIAAIGSRTIGPSQLGMRQEYNWLSFIIPIDHVREFIKGTPAELTIQ